MTFSNNVVAAALFSAVLGGNVALAQSDDFQAFWKAFSMAVAKNDQAALRAMTKVSHDVIDDYTAVFGESARACLAKAKAKKDPEGYQAFCDDGIYTFSRKDGAWSFSDYSPDD